MEKTDIKRGDLVALKSHPHVPMTVYAVNSFVVTHWFCKKNKLQRAEFFSGQLTPYKPLPRVEIG